MAPPQIRRHGNRSLSQMHPRTIPNRDSTPSTNLFSTFQSVWNIAEIRMDKIAVDIPDIKMYQSIWKDHNIFVHPLFPNGLVFNECNTLKNNILTELKLGTKDMRKGNRHLMK